MVRSRYRSEPQTDRLLGTLGGQRPLSLPSFGEDGPQHTTTVTNRVEVTDSMESRILVARDLGDD